MAPYVLDPHVGFSVLSHSRGERDRHEELGCGLQGPASRPLRRALGGLKARIRRLGKAKAIERAEARLEEGTFGVSVVSGDPIPDGRLEAIPWADRTVSEEQSGGG